MKRNIFRLFIFSLIVTMILSQSAVLGAADESEPAVEQLHSHSYVSVITQEATCQEEGILTYTCSCGEEYTEVIAKTAHLVEEQPAEFPTCASPGMTWGLHCKTCGEVFVAREPVEQLEHVPGNPVVEIQTSLSYDEVCCCINCGAELSRQHVVISLPGDVNEDGQIDLKDVAALFRSVTYASARRAMADNPMDIDNDGAVTLKDVSMLYGMVVCP